MLLKKLVVAEDEDAIAYTLTTSLGDVGYLCLRARDGEEALALVRAQMPDALILDVMMPKMTGVEVVRQLKSDVATSRVPVLMLSSLDRVEDKVRGLDTGADDYLPKPFDFRELRARVAALIRQNRRERDRDPTTNLPGGPALEDHIAELVAKGKAFSFAFLEIEGTRACFERQGFTAVQALFRRLGDIVLAETRGGGFAAHLGSGDFAVACDPAAGSTPASELFAAIARRYLEGAPEGAQGTWVRITEVDGSGCRTVEELATRVAHIRGAALV